MLSRHSIENARPSEMARSVDPSLIHGSTMSNATIGNSVALTQPGIHSVRIAKAGKDGCVVVVNDDQALKRFFRGVKSHERMQQELKRIDPEELRFVRHHRIGKKDRTEWLSAPVWSTCGARPLSSRVVRMRRLGPLAPKELTRHQYRYLRESLRLLHKSGWVHLDLPGNVMMGTDNLPRIIDWETAQPVDDVGRQVDNHAFLNEFGVSKR